MAGHSSLSFEYLEMNRHENHRTLCRCVRVCPPPTDPVFSRCRLTPQRRLNHPHRRVLPAERRSVRLQNKGASVIFFHFIARETVRLPIYGLDVHCTPLIWRADALSCATLCKRVTGARHEVGIHTGSSMCAFPFHRP
jgi:hypothetical protein